MSPLTYNGFRYIRMPPPPPPNPQLRYGVWGSVQRVSMCLGHTYITFRKPRPHRLLSPKHSLPTTIANYAKPKEIH